MVDWNFRRESEHAFCETEKQLGVNVILATYSAEHDLESMNCKRTIKRNYSNQIGNY